MKLTYIRWSMTIIETAPAAAGTRPVTIVTDPVFRMLGVRQAPKSYTFDRMPRPDLVFVSHTHPDHFEPATLRRLAPDTPIWIPADAAHKASRLGLTAVRGVQAWESDEFQGVRLTAVPALHGGGELGLVVEGDRTVYFAGDTSIDAELFRGLSQRWAFDAVLLPIGDLRTVGVRIGHIGPRSAARALLLLGQPRVVVPTHYSGMKIAPLITLPGTPRKLSVAVQKSGLGTVVGTSRPMDTVDI